MLASGRCTTAIELRSCLYALGLKGVGSASGLQGLQPLVRIRSPRFAASETMASADTAAEVRDMCWVFGFKGCPLHDEKCPKAKQWLGGGRQRFYTERRTRQTVFDHLMNSPFHQGMTIVAALNLAWAADVESWEIPAEESLEKIAETIAWEEELVTFDSPDLKESVNTAQPKGGSKGGGSKGGSSQDGKGGGAGKCGGVMVPVRKRPHQPAEPAGQPSRHIARISDRLETNIKQQTSNAWAFVSAMTKAESALRTAAKVSEAAHRTFMDIPDVR